MTNSRTIELNSTALCMFLTMLRFGGSTLATIDYANGIDVRLKGGLVVDNV